MRGGSVLFSFTHDFYLHAMPKEIIIKNASTHNLKDVSLTIPHHQLIVVTGISGSGKSSLVFDVIAREGQRRYFETIPSFAKQFLGKLKRPEVEQLEGLSPVITIGQKTGSSNVRSTVGTVSDIYDLLRLLYARFGETREEIKLTRSLFSFNTEQGWCPVCKGIGQEEKIDISKLVSEPDKTIREGALAPTLPTGYIMYSQVTMEVLDQVCKAEGFDVDHTWNQLTEDQRNVILYGSEKIKVPFGKHSLESRLKWTGIKAKPREEGYFKGMITIMSDILKRDRNPNILKYAHAVTCSCCKGKKLSPSALDVQVKNKSIADLASYSLSELSLWLEQEQWESIAQNIINRITSKINTLEQLGLGHLTINRPTSSITGSEIQRIRLSNQTEANLSNVLYVFDEPSIGLHPSENQQVIQLLRNLVNQGNTVMVVEHDLDTIKQSDWIIDIGPGAGIDGGKILYNGTLKNFLKKKDFEEISPTYKALHSTNIIEQRKSDKNSFQLIGCYQNNLKQVDVSFKIEAINVVSGKSGSGKKSLVLQTLKPLVEHKEDVKIKKAIGIDSFTKTVFVDQSPIGRTPRSNPATYIGLSDKIRDLYASLPEAKEKKFTKSRFSFNNKGGRCEACQGAGKTQIGMHFLGKIDSVCGVCNGKRFNPETLEIKYSEKSIADVYQLSINEAFEFFEGQNKILSGLQLLQQLGLGYLKLGQSSTTLSGGEAQRIKLANELQKKNDGKGLYLLNQPCIGLHYQDIENLLTILNQLADQGNSIVCIEQDEQFIANSHWHIELGNDGHILHQGTPKQLESSGISLAKTSSKHIDHIQLRGVKTHLLKNIDVTFPKNRITAVTGLSGSGKTTLVFDTLFAEANNRFSSSFSTYQRSFLHQNNEAVLDNAIGLTPTIAIKKIRTHSNRSTVGTISGIYDYLRLLYSRISQLTGHDFTAQQFSFNHQLGACHHCDGKGTNATCNPENIIVSTYSSILTDATNPNKALMYYTNPNGQFVAILKEVALQRGINLNKPWSELNEDEKEVILYGTGNQEWSTEWNFKTKTRSGTQSIQSKWLGFCGYINDEYYRKLHNKDISSLQELMHDVTCSNCNGSRLKPSRLEVELSGKNIFELTSLSVDKLIKFIEDLVPSSSKEELLLNAALPKVESTLQTLQQLGLGHLTLNRSASTLSGGEAQRLSLAGHLSTHLYGVTYVLDEPSVGLDIEQIKSLNKVLKELTLNGNTVVVIEHDKEVIKHADYLIELGPESGTKGGHVVFQGALDQLTDDNSITYQLLNKDNKLDKVDLPENSGSFKAIGAHQNNLKNIDVEFFSNQINVVSGVSGSGKSSLVNEVIYQSYLRKRPVGCSAIEGLDLFDDVILVDQHPISINSLTTPASYTGTLDQLRGIYAKSDSAKELKLKRADFSYQSKNGKCPTCSGYGKVKTSMDFMSDIWNPCETCNGLRYNSTVLSCQLNGKSIGEFLQLSINEALSTTNDKKLVDQLTILTDLGLGHIQLGQAGNTLSGGEVQRLKLAKLLQSDSKNNLFILDEPSTGLHYYDLIKLSNVFNDMIKKGHTILMVEHHSALINSAHHIVKLGPGCGENGGRIIH